MIVFRLIKKKYSHDWGGKGAELIGRRWNSKGVPMIYASESRSLCTVEVAVNLPMGVFPTGFEMISIEIPDHITIKEIKESDLPAGWKEFPFIELTQHLGNEFIIQNEFLAMKVPSAVIPGDFNYLLNPRHPDFEKIQVIKNEPYEFDERFFQR
jgi:RES domain-containing protein